MRERLAEDDPSPFAMDFLDPSTFSWAQWLGISCAVGIGLLLTIGALLLLFRFLRPVAIPRFRFALATSLVGLGLFLFCHVTATIPTVFLFGLHENASPIYSGIRSWLFSVLGGAFNAGFVGLALLVASGLLLLVPRLAGDKSPTTLGIGLASPFGGMIQGTLAYLCIIPGFIGISLGWLVALRMFGVEPEEQAAVHLLRFYFLLGDWTVPVGIALLVSIGAPLSEEILFRGMIFRALEPHLGSIGSIVLSGVLFGAFHFNVAAFVPITALGIALALLYHRTGSLWAPIFLHAIFNGLQVLMVFLIPSL